MLQNAPILPHRPLITSKNENWDGIYLRHDRQPAYSIPRHSHSQHTIIISLGNALQAEWSIDGKFRDLQYNKGDVFIVPANVPHRAYWKHLSEGITLALEPESMVKAAIDSVNSDRIELIPQFATSDLRLFQIAQWLLIELQQQQIGGSLYVESLTTMLMVHLLRNYSVVKPKIPDYRGGLAPHKLQIALAFIQENLHCDIKLAEIAALVAMSPYHFARMFKQSTGFTPHQYLVRQRLTKAQELLRSSKIAIADIGYMVGYRNPSHFTSVFRKHFKVTPKAYRNSF